MSTRRRGLALRTMSWVVTTVALAALVRMSAVEPYRIPSNSMEPALLEGDYVVVDKASMGLRFLESRLQPYPTRALRSGDVIVFTSPDDPETAYIKRVTGIPGDTLEMRNGVLLRNARLQREGYARRSPDKVSDATDFLWQRRYLLPTEDRASYLPTSANWGPIVVPRNSYFVLGDNRGKSFDSRHWGFVPFSRIRGRALFIYGSLGGRSAGDSSQRLRWARIGMRL